MGEQPGIRVLEQDRPVEPSAQLVRFPTFESDGKCLFEHAEESFPSLSFCRWADDDRLAHHVTSIPDLALASGIVVELALDSAVVNLFLIGWSRPRPVDVVEARQAVAGLVHELPFFDERSLRAWRAPSGQLVLACAGHRPGETSGVVYEHLDPDHVALFSGRPFIWTEEFKADGRTPLDARFFLGNPDEWSELLDGRCVAVRYDDTTSTLDVYTDPLGSYHLYVTERDGQSWLSNNSELLRRLTSTRTINPLVLASLVGCGWSFGGQPPWDGIRRLPPGGHRFRPGAADARRELLPAKSIGGFLDRGLDSQAAARTLVAAVRALADWPGRPKYLSLTGGRDSRLVFAAALRDGIEFEPRIIAGSEEEPETEDIRVARLVAESVGCTLRVAFSHPVATLDDAARILRLAAPGALQLDFAWAALNRPDQQWWLERSRERLPLPLVLTGQGGEIARRWYDIGSRRARPRPYGGSRAASRSSGLVLSSPARASSCSMRTSTSGCGHSWMPVPRWCRYPSSSISSSARRIGRGRHMRSTST